MKFLKVISYILLTIAALLLLLGLGSGNLLGAFVFGGDWITFGLIGFFLYKLTEDDK